MRLKFLAVIAALILPVQAYAQVQNPGVQQKPGVSVTTGHPAVWSSNGVITDIGDFPADAVSSVFGRTGAVVAAVNDYNFNQLAGRATLAQLPSGAALSLLGVAGNAPADYAGITTASGSNGVFRENGGTLGFGSISGVQINNNSIPAARMATAAGNVIVGALTAGNAANLPVPSCSGAGDVLQWVAATGFQCVNSVPVVESVPPGGKLTLASATPNMQVSQTSKTQIWYAPVGLGRYVPIYTLGTGMRLVPFTTSATDNIGPTINLAASANWAANSNYDVFAYYNAGQASICTGPDWSAGAVAGSNTMGSSSRGTGAGSTEHQFYQGYQTNKNTMTCRTGAATTVSCAVNECTYLGYFRTTTAGTTTFTFGAVNTAANLLVYNAYNQSQVCTTTKQNANWNYTSATIRQQAGNAISQVAFLQEGSSTVTAQSLVTANVAAVIGAIYRSGVALDSTTVEDTYSQSTNVAAQTLTSSQSVPNMYPGTFGPHTIYATENGDGTNSTLGVAAASSLNVCAVM